MVKKKKREYAVLLLDGSKDSLKALQSQLTNGFSIEGNVDTNCGVVFVLVK